MDEAPIIVEPLADLTNYRQAKSHAGVLQAYTRRPVEDPKHVTAEEADRAEARAIQLANFVPFEGIPRSDAATLAQILQRLEQMETNINHRFNHIEEKIDNLEKKINNVEVIALKALNGTRGDGTWIEYELIPFTDGKLPSHQTYQVDTQPPYVYLRRATDIAKLQSAQLTQYLSSYGVAAAAMPTTVKAKRKELYRIIGVSADLLSAYDALSP
ncbi:hypothetical protein PC9H_010126 [Pleurotus ostreatus]|uniref:Mug135-like C-terminal domain-containing protein n=2 Tax=Pleurotus ostreatus TaxID=5322 RepID=A0A8H6ZQZ9_PLEOS|nr:uncharacterized protein PC9H_010118 [Pleurotus ostreatus]XP_036629009.1 uncharacterized protein PC9H_010126 [Pleurotus ostreatus]KDQ25040.1 hypothetical protein PLEOSDRAFT_1094515 [Pleurotus ostreatus PC15]KAF7424807.1 hypothetical protein PC9H_010118 [Pleurotus ostreatus]KAF7424815.1 hypothetical protein PC9H_010126 [Pleurotus ostreatus]KAJ8692169.1 hypothetical protein PTI98_009506 [Pleurotus ostreatus]KAJ8692176.1 hypothetical protein PTI98_009513 [Pleurotus ostreatus]